MLLFLLKNSIIIITIILSIKCLHGCWMVGWHHNDHHQQNNDHHQQNYDDYQQNNAYMEVGWQTGRLEVRIVAPARVLGCCVLESYHEDGGFDDEHMMIMIMFVMVMMVVSSMIGLPPLAVLVGSQRNRSLEGLNLENNPQIFS